MNVLFLSLTDFDHLEDRGIYTDLLRTFIRHGHYVYAVSPMERRKKHKTYYIEEENLFILKPRIGNIQKTNLIEKGISVITLEWRLKRSLKTFTSTIKFDLILYSTPPITFSKIVQYVKKRDHAKTYLLLKDIFPQNALDLGILSKRGTRGIFYRYFRKKEKQIYGISDYIGCMSPANIEFVWNQNPELRGKIVEVCPNSFDIVEVPSIEKCDLKNRFHIPKEATAFLYGGNLGKPQDIDFVIRCLIQNLDFEDRYFVICGTGTEYHKLEAFFHKVKPSNMRLLNGLPQTQFDELVKACEVGLIFLDHRFTIPNIPSRLLTYMECSIPTLACTDITTDIGTIIEAGKFGWWCESNCELGFYEKVNEICEKKDYLGEYGNNARLYLEKHYTTEESYQIIMKHF